MRAAVIHIGIAAANYYFKFVLLRRIIYRS